MGGPSACGGQATAAQPDNAALWGKLALGLRALSDFATPAQTADALQACELAAARALALDARQADARVALTMLRPAYGDWLEVEGKLRAILETAPSNIDALGSLAPVLKSVGRDAEACAIQERVAAQEALSPLHQYRLTYNLWTAGRLGEADRVIDRAIELWPLHPGVWSARLWLSAFTGRTAAALAQIDDADVRPPTLAPQVNVLRLSINALQSRRPEMVEAAVAANVAAAKAGPAGSITGIMLLTALGRLDEAFSVANGYLLRRGSNVMPLRYADGQPAQSDQRHRKTLMLFIPVTAPLRADPRFIDICRGCGLADYWRRSGHWPDFLGSRRIA